MTQWLDACSLKAPSSQKDKQRHTRIKTWIEEAFTGCEAKYLADNRGIKAFIMGSSIYPSIELYLTVSFIDDLKYVSVTCSPLRNGLPFAVRSKQVRLSINKLFSKVNTPNENLAGGLTIDQVSGEISARIGGFMSEVSYWQLVNNGPVLVNFVERQIFYCEKLLKANIYQVLHLVNELPLAYQRDKHIQRLSHVRTIDCLGESTMRMIQKVLRRINVEEQWMYNEDSIEQVVTPDFMKKIHEVSEVVRRNHRRFNDISKGIIQMFAGRGCVESTPVKNPSTSMMPSFLKLTQSFANQANSLNPVSGNDRMLPMSAWPEHFPPLAELNEQDRHDFKSVIYKDPVLAKDNEPTAVLNQIRLQRPSEGHNWTIVDRGGFGVISKCQMEFQYVGSESRPHADTVYTRILVKKEDYPPPDASVPASKLPHQKQVLSMMSSHGSHFVARFYYSTQQSSQNILYMEFYPEKSLHNFRQRTSEYLSLSSRLYQLRGIAQSIKFLKDNKICHLDLKPANILIASNRIGKLSDFGEAFHPQVCPKEFRPGTSLPYAPPESFSPDLIQFSDRMDIFSFGVLLYETMYDSFPVQNSKHLTQMLKKHYCMKTYPAIIMVPPQRCSQVGYKVLYEVLTYLSLACMGKDERKRPCIEWIIIVLQCCISMAALVSSTVRQY